MHSITKKLPIQNNTQQNAQIHLKKHWTTSLPLLLTLSDPHRPLKSFHGIKWGKWGKWGLLEGVLAGGLTAVGDGGAVTDLLLDCPTLEALSSSLKDSSWQPPSSSSSSTAVSTSSVGTLWNSCEWVLATSRAKGLIRGLPAASSSKSLLVEGSMSWSHVRRERWTRREWANYYEVSTWRRAPANKSCHCSLGTKTRYNKTHKSVLSFRYRVYGDQSLAGRVGRRKCGRHCRRHPKNAMLDWCPLAWSIGFRCLLNLEISTRYACQWSVA